jgi:F0F1-type ATP synthase membrane subunit c/vacuolar-type H+-ATPase subunit K
VAIPNIVEVVADPLGDVTRKERRSLLLASVISSSVAILGLVPTKISALGIELEAPARTAFLILLALVITYFLFAFIVYGLVDLLIWRNKYDEHLLAVAEALEDELIEDALAEAVPKARTPRPNWLFTGYRPLAVLRVLFDLLLPLILGIATIVLLLLRATSVSR